MERANTQKETGVISQHVAALLRSKTIKYSPHPNNAPNCVPCVVYLRAWTSACVQTVGNSHVITHIQ